MEPSVAKRRKLGHPSAGPISSNAGSATPGASAFSEATDELLKDVKLDYGKTFDGADDILRQLKDAIEAIEPHEPQPIATVSVSFEKANKVAIPYPNPRPGKDSLYKLSFAKPAHINVVGSYQLRTMIKSQSDPSIDMIVVMPSSLFQEKDYRDLRYFYKRSYYLAYITSSIRKAFSSLLDVTFDFLHEDELLPILVVRPKASAKSNKTGYAIRIIPCAPEGLFPAAKLLPTSNSLRQGAALGSKDSESPTPFYNATIKADSQFSAYLRLLNSSAKSCPAFRDACILGRVWLQQRGFCSSISGGGFGHFEWAILTALLLQGGGRKGEAILSNSLNSSQLFKAVIQYLATTNFQKKPVIVGSSPPNLEALRQGSPVFYDSARELNLLWKMTPWSSNFLQKQAKWSLSELKAESLDQFESLFIVRCDQVLQTFDLVATITPTAEDALTQSADLRGPRLGFSDRLYHILKKAVGERAQLVHVMMPSTSSWSVSTTPSNPFKSVTVGFILESSHATRRMDLGPSVEQKKEAARFRDFWGDRAELRRFQDGSILESIEWDMSSTSSIPEQIIRYILKKHLSLPSDAIQVFCESQFSAIAHISSTDSHNFNAAKKAFEILEHDVRNLEDLPLHVRQIAPISPELRSASRQAPVPGKVPFLPMDVIISFEASGKWTDNIAANQRLKIAFLLKVGSSLEEAKDEIKTHLGLDEAEKDTHNLAFLDIVYEDGFAFRLRVQSDIEERELEKTIKNKQVEKHVQLDAAESLAICKRLYTNLPLHNQTISTWCTRFPPLSESIRLVKYWFSSHKLTCHFSEELLELFVLQAFLKPYPWSTPSTALTGFLRTMQVLSRWEWHEEPLIIDHTESISASGRAAIYSRYEECRRLDPRLNRVVLFVATSHDATGTAYTQHGPSRVVANQMTKLCRSVCELVKSRGVELDPRSLFQSSIKHYDVVIRLDAKVLKATLRDDGIKHSHFKNLNERNKKMALPLVEHPAQTLLKQLNAVYSGVLVFFHGGPEDHVIAGLWNPDLGRRTRKVDMPCAFRPVEGEDDALEVDRRAMGAEIARIGGDLIGKVEIKGED